MSTFKEEYIITYNIKKPDGFWLISEQATVHVDVRHGVNEKNNHKLAKRQFLRNNPKAKVRRVDYI